MIRKYRLNLALLISFAYLIGSQFGAQHLPEALAWLAYPTSLIGGVLTFSGLLPGILLAALGVGALTLLAYWLLGFFCEQTNASTNDQAQ